MDNKPKTKRIKIFERDNYTCYICKQVFDKKSLSLDHYLPKTFGGSNDESNLRTCCKDCNEKKGCKLPQEFVGIKAELKRRQKNKRLLKKKLNKKKLELISNRTCQLTSTIEQYLQGQNICVIQDLTMKNI